MLATEPDGDPIRFVADDPAAWKLVPGPDAVRVNAHGGAQLRLDGIDALETHYAPPGGRVLHQPLEPAHAAAAELLAWLGFPGVMRGGEQITSARQDALPGFLLTRTADLYGRCVALIGRGDAPGESGAQIMVDPALLETTANHHLITTGLAYPTFYTRLYVNLRNELAQRAGFPAFLARRDDRLYVIPTAEKTGLDSIVEVTDQIVKLSWLPEQLLFDEE